MSDTKYISVDMYLLPLILEQIRQSHPKLAIKLSPAVEECEDVPNVIAWNRPGQMQAW